MRFVYPYVTEREGDSIIVHFPDVPGTTAAIASSGSRRSDARYPDFRKAGTGDGDVR